MLLAKIFQYFLVVFVLIINIVLAEDKVYMIPYTLEECEPRDIKIDANIELTEKNGAKVVNAELDLPFDFTENFKFLAEIDEKKSDGNWVLNAYKLDGELCEIALEFGATWKIFRMQLDPPVADFDDECYLPAGKYVLPDLEFSKDDVEMPTDNTGYFKMTLHIYNEDKEEFLCRVLEFEVKK